MSMCTAVVRYTRIPVSVLSVHPKTFEPFMGLRYRNEFLLAIECYRSNRSPFAGNQSTLSVYEQRWRKEALDVLIDRGILKAGEQPGTYEPLELDAGNSVAILDYDYSRLCLNELKTLLALYVLVDHNPVRESFYLVRTAESLSEVTGIPRENVSRALSQLQRKQLLRIVPSNERKRLLNTQKKDTPIDFDTWLKDKSKFWTGQGSAIYLVDPVTGEDIHELDMFFRNREASMEPWELYQMTLATCDPKGTLAGPFKGLPNVLFDCPLCHGRNNLRVTCIEREDGSWEDLWKCFKCNRGGNALSLAYRAKFIYRYSWRKWELRKEIRLEPQQFRPAEEYSEWERQRDEAFNKEHNL